MPPNSKQLPQDQPAPTNPEPVPGAEDENEETTNYLLLFHYVPSWLTSFVLHVTVIVLLALVPMLVPQKETVDLIASAVGPAAEAAPTMDLSPLDNEDLQFDDQPVVDVSEPNLQPLTDAPELTTNADPMALSELMSAGELGADTNASLMSAASAGGNELAARRDAGKSADARKAGATDATEECVALGLKWLAEHQLPDGSWNFNHQIGPGDRSSPNPGMMSDCPIAATSMCIMAFLGNGQTHLEGGYKEVVSQGLSFLMRSQRRDNGIAGSLTDGRWQAGAYSHGLGTIALAEAYGMTKDPALRESAQAAINYIGFAQDPRGGGWRYDPQSEGDLSVTGWMLMGLKSGLMGNLEVRKEVTRKAAKFLDAVMFESGSRYCYRAGNQDPSANMTSVGLLCRMYMGWKREHPGIQRGAKYLAKHGPEVGTSTNMYFNYYAAQVLRQFGGPEWTEFNKELSSYLVRTQSREGATKGSWFFDSDSDYGPAAGGRVYCTAMAVMTLEVYYRFLPIYRDSAVEEEFPLD
jgi:hypothetical protein